MIEFATEHFYTQKIYVHELCADVEHVLPHHASRQSGDPVSRLARRLQADAAAGETHIPRLSQLHQRVPAQSRDGARAGALAITQTASKRAAPRINVFMRRTPVQTDVRSIGGPS